LHSLIHKKITCAETQAIISWKQENKFLPAEPGTIVIIRSTCHTERSHAITVLPVCNPALFRQALPLKLPPRTLCLTTITQSIPVVIIATVGIILPNPTIHLGRVGKCGSLHHSQYQQGQQAKPE
jgi:hypothetical protein